MTRILRAAALLAAAVLAAQGCADALTRQPPKKQRFVLVPGAPPPAAAKQTAGVLRVDVVRAAPLFANRGFVYRTGADAIASDFYNEFYAPPAALVRDALVDWLGATGRFAAVVRATEARVDWVVESELERIDADLGDGSQPTTTLALDVRLVAVRAGTAKLLLQKRYEESVPAASRAPHELVDAWSHALARALGRIAADVGAAATDAR